ncbi:MAG: AraC family transcriptional regulator [Methyloligellaceae bacterium]
MSGLTTTQIAPEPSLSGVAVSVLTSFLDSRKLLSSQVMRRASLDPGGVGEAHYYAPLAHLARAFSLSAELVSDPFIGLHAPEYYRPPVKHAHLFALQNAPNVDTALTFLELHMRNVMRVETSITRDRRGAILEWQCPLTGSEACELNDFIARRLIVNISHAAGASFRPAAVEMARPMPATRAEHERCLGAPVEFEHPWNRMAIDRQWLQRPVAGADRNLYRILKACCRELDGQEPRVPDLTEHLSRLFSRTLPHEQLSLQEAADCLGVTPTRLRNDLRARGTTFRQVRNLTRQALARHYLGETALPLGEISNRLGFSEQSAFTRAARRWFGTSPLHYRRWQARERGGGARPGTPRGKFPAKRIAPGGWQADFC